MKVYGEKRPVGKIATHQFCFRCTLEYLQQPLVPGVRGVPGLRKRGFFCFCLCYTVVCLNTWLVHRGWLTLQHKFDLHFRST